MTISNAKGEKLNPQNRFPSQPWILENFFSHNPVEGQNFVRRSLPHPFLLSLSLSLSQWQQIIIMSYHVNVYANKTHDPI